MQINMTWSLPAVANQHDNHQLLATSLLHCLKHKWRGLSCHPHSLSLPQAPSVTGNVSGGVLSACHPPSSLKTQAEGSSLLLERHLYLCMTGTGMGQKYIPEGYPCCSLHRI